MPIEINGRTYYRTNEVCQIVGISKSTLFRWIKKNVVMEAEYRDRKGWRLFTEGELDMLVAEAARIQRNEADEMERIPSSVR
jgi:DNA-binding transcriptional MerR regulator